MTKDTGNRVGIDIGSCAIKVIQVSGPADKPVLNAIGYRNISGFSGPEISDSLKALVTECHVTAKDASISISGPSVIVRL